MCKSLLNSIKVRNPAITAKGIRLITASICPKASPVNNYTIYLNLSRSIKLQKYFHLLEFMKKTLHNLQIAS